MLVTPLHPPICKDGAYSFHTHGIGQFSLSGVGTKLDRRALAAADATTHSERAQNVDSNRPESQIPNVLEKNLKVIS